MDMGAIYNRRRYLLFQKASAIPGRRECWRCSGYPGHARNYELEQQRGRIVNKQQYIRQQQHLGINDIRHRAIYNQCACPVYKQRGQRFEHHI